MENTRFTIKFDDGCITECEGRSWNKFYRYAKWCVQLFKCDAVLLAGIGDNAQPIMKLFHDMGV